MIHQIGLQLHVSQSAQSPALLLLAVDPELWPEPRHEMLHLKAVFAKTHTRSEADLTRVLTRQALLTPQPELKAGQACSA